MHFTLDAVISAGMNLIGQLQPRAKVRFVRGDMDPSLAAGAERIWMLTRLAKTLAWCQVGMMLGGAPGKTQPQLQTPCPLR
jgi:allophanate hydrolase subunit 2